MTARCPNCAALAREADQRYCAYCGHALPREEPPPASRPPSVAELLAEVERHPELRSWMAHRPSGVGFAFGLGATAVFGLVFAGIALVMLKLVGGFGGMPGVFGLVPLLFVGVGLLVAFGVGAKALRFVNAPLLRVPALIVDERTAVSGGGRNSSASTSYNATLEAADGRREEYRIDGRLAGRVAPGDYGLAYLRGGILLDFRRAGSR